MSKLKLSAILFLVFAVVAFPIAVFAQVDSPEQRIVTLSKNQTINHDYFAAGNEVTIDGTVNGDAYVGAGKVDVNGTINGDLIVAGGQVTVRGRVSQNVRALGGNITVEGNVGRNVSLLGGNLTIDTTAKIAGNAVLAGGNIDVLSQVKDLTIGGGNLHIANNVLGNVTAGVGTLTVADGTNIRGDLNYWSQNKANISNGATISGQTNFHEVKEVAKAQESSRKAAGIISGFSLFMTLISFIASLLLGILLISFFPTYSQQMSNLITNKIGTATLVGFFAIIFIPVVTVILMLTLIGFPIALILLFTYFVALYLSKIFVAMAIGAYAAKISKMNLNSIWAFVLGLALYYIFGFIPIVGWVLKMFVAFIGMGAIILQKKYYFETLRSKNLI